MRIELYDDVLMVYASQRVPDSVTKALSYWHRGQEYDEKLHRRVNTGEVRALYTIDEAGTTLMTLPGFCSDIFRILGAGTEFVDKRTNNVKPDMKAGLANLRDYQLEVAYDAISARGGIVNCATGFGKSFLMMALCNAYPKEHLRLTGCPMTVIVTPTKDLCTKNYKMIKAVLTDRHVGCWNSDKKEMSDDILVITPESLRNKDISDCGLLIYDECHTLSPARMQTVMKAQKAMRYGFSATPEGRSDGSDLCVKGTFGPEVVRKTYQDGVACGALVPIKVIWLPLPYPQYNWPKKEYVNKDHTLKKGLWQNERFHKLVKELYDFLPKNRQQLYLADTVTHIDRLMTELPDIKVVHAETSAKSIKERGFKNVEAISKNNRNKLYSSFEKKKINSILSSGIYRTGVDFPDLEFCVNLAGRASSIISQQLPGRASRKTEGKEYSYTIDFWPKWDMVQDPKKQGELKAGALLRDAQSRRKTYTKLGFQQVNINLVEELYDICGGTS